MPSKSTIFAEGLFGPLLQMLMLFSSFISKVNIYNEIIRNTVQVRKDKDVQVEQMLLVLPYEFNIFFSCGNVHAEKQPRNTHNTSWRKSTKN